MNAAIFRPLPLIAGPHLQTIVAATFRLPLRLPAAALLVDLPDGDRIACAVSTPAGWRDGDPTVVLIHGLCGGEASPYMARMAWKLHRRGLRAVRMNLRGCGSGKGLARRPYHSGRSEDALAVLDHLRAESPRSPVTLVGFSLGGNIALKLAGELGEAARGRLEQVIAVCPPADLKACSRRISAPSNRLYERFFVRLLREGVAERHAFFSDMPPVHLPGRMTLYQFDDLYTAPQCGFAGAADYYEKCSSRPLVPGIAVCCRILFAADDPIIDPGALDGSALPPSVEVVKTARGGHLGFLGIPGLPGGYRWLDALLLEWIGGGRAAAP